MLWIKALHIISMVTWFAGIFYLPRLFVYHAQASDTLGQDRFIVMEEKLYRIIMTPSAIVTIVFGTALVTFNPQFYLTSTWFILKIILVALVLVYHVYCKVLMRQFASHEGIKTEKYYRIFNELPVLMLISIILLVVVKPGF